MASHFQIQKPYVLTTLPRPVDPTTGRYVVGSVFGSNPGSRKRKRSELTVGTDGDSVNIYDVSSARLVTSYPIPPQSSFSCPAYSIRQRIPDGNAVARYTYAATEDAPDHAVTLFKDHVDASGKTTSTTKSYSLGAGSPVVFLARTTGASEEEEVLVVRANGEIISLDPETLQKKWQSPPSTLAHSLGSASAKEGFKVEFCCTAPASDVIQGLFKGNSDSFSLFPGSALTKESSMEVLVLVSNAGAKDQQTRHLHVVGILPSRENSVGLGQKTATIHMAPIQAPQSQQSSKPLYRLDVRSGTLLELAGEVLSTYDLTLSTPRPASTMRLEDATSFLRLTQTSLLSSTTSQLDVYNPVFRSLQSSTPLELENQSQTSVNGQGSRTTSLVSYFSKLELAIAIVDSNLVAIQLEAPKIRTKKRRAEGLLVDSLGRGVSSKERPSGPGQKVMVKSSAFTNYLPGSVKGDYWDVWTAEESRADALLAANDTAGFESLLAEKFGLRVAEDIQANGTSSSDEDKDIAKSASGWKWPKSRASYPYADRRWVLYGISRTFDWKSPVPSDDPSPHLICQLPQSNVVNYLVDAGHLTLSNIKAAFRTTMHDSGKSDSYLAEQLIHRIADIDPSLELLSAYISATTLSPVELLIAVRTLMRSLELVQDPRQPAPKLLTDGSTEQDKTEAIEQMEIDNLEEQVEKAESYLNGDGGVRGSGLSVAFAKLANCPSLTMVKALRSTFKPEEILSLVYLLRVELVKGAWTSRYLDNTDFEQNADLDAPPDNIIKLISDLLGRCVDSLGPGGWLLNDAILAGDESGDFISALKLEVSAALEGLEEAVYLRGIVGEAVKYNEAAVKAAEAQARTDRMKPIALHVKEPGAEALPLGLKAKQSVSKEKVVSGGEIIKRSNRETGHLRSQQVGAYSLERIAI